MGRCGVGIIIGGDKGKFGDKVEDFKNREGARGKDKDDVGKRFSHEGEITDKNNEKKCKNRAGGTKN